MSPNLLRSLSISLKAIAHALETEAQELDERGNQGHDYALAQRLPFNASGAATPAVKRLVERGAIEQCKRCGAVRTTVKPWRFWHPGAKAWSGRKPACSAHP